MIDILHFIFSSFWTWLGTLLLVIAASRFSIIRINHEQNQKINSPSDDHHTEANTNE